MPLARPGRQVQDTPGAELAGREQSEYEEDGSSGEERSSGGGRDSLGSDGKAERCGACDERGELVTCDMADCPSAFHLGCVGLQALPQGDWFCPLCCGLRAPQRQRGARVAAQALQGDAGAGYGQQLRGVRGVATAADWADDEEEEVGEEGEEEDGSDEDDDEEPDCDLTRFI